MGGELNSWEGDLTWLLKSPDLLSIGEKSISIEAGESIDQWLIRLESLPNWKELNEELSKARSKKRLGKYAEDLFNCYASNSSQFQNVHQGIQVRDGGHTYGEFDFLIQEEGRSDWIHLELALKFYLAVNIEGKTHFIGPNAKDSLERKIAKMLHQQMSLSSTDAGEKLLKEMGVSIKQISALIKGYVFINPSSSDPINLDVLNPYACKGWWYYPEQFKSARFNSSRFVILEKNNWLMHTHDINQSLSFEEIRLELEEGKIKLPALIAEVDIGDRLYEKSRGFVVKPDWLKDWN